jgi:hypothetical protein
MKHRSLYLFITAVSAAFLLAATLYAPTTTRAHSDPAAPAACPTPIKKNWLIKGNCGTSGGTNFLATTDNQPLVVKTNGTERLRVLTSGNVGIGTNNPLQLLSLRGASDFSLSLRNDAQPTDNKVWHIGNYDSFES